MEQAVKRLFMWILTSAALPVVADQPIEDQAIANQFFADQAIIEMARVVTEYGGLEECLASVEITRVDGVKQVVPAHGFQIESGVHSLNGRAILDTTKCKPLNGNQKIPGAVDLLVNFEAGNTYYIAYDRSHPSIDEWKLVVWKVEQADPPENQMQSQDGISLPSTEHIQ